MNFIELSVIGYCVVTNGNHRSSYNSQNIEKTLAKQESIAITRKTLTAPITATIVVIGVAFMVEFNRPILIPQLVKLCRCTICTNKTYGVTNSSDIDIFFEMRLMRIMRFQPLLNWYNSADV